MYVVDELAIADAIVLRARLRAAVPEQSMRSESRLPLARSFRRDRDARSFRLSRDARLHRTHH
jgi:hypothetical protein